MNKKAVSPLIATVLLVMIVVSIGAAVMVVIQGITEEQLDVISEQQTLVKCDSSIKAKVLDTGTSLRMCYNTSGSSGTLALHIENTGSEAISGFRLLVAGDNVSTQIFDNTAIASGGSSDLKFSFANVAASNSEIDVIRLMPRVPGEPGKAVATCTLPSLEWEQADLVNIDDCTKSTVTWDDSTAAETATG